LRISIKSLKKQIKHNRKYQNVSRLAEQRLRRKLIKLDSLMSDNRVLH